MAKWIKVLLGVEKERCTTVDESTDFPHAFDVAFAKLLWPLVKNSCFVLYGTQELLGVTSDRLIRMNLQTGDTVQTWRLSSMKSWSVNWQFKQFHVSFEDDELVFECLTADCKVVHEFIGGYIFLSMRSGDRSQTLNEELFHKLTGGWG